ncbi:MAG TPA: hypothetical protein PK961_01175 [bacterium]|nr:hypothetical protein [bacterium]
MRNACWTAVALVALVGALAALAVGEEAAKPLPELPGVTVVKGAQIYGLLGQDAGRLRLFAIADNGEATAIPFQIDPCDSAGRYVLPVAPVNGNTKHLRRKILRQEADGNALDEHDELVFATADAGPRAPAAVTFQHAAKVLEIELTGPNKTKGYVYLTAYAGTPPPLSPLDYVAFNPQAEAIFTDRYVARYRPGKQDLAVSSLRLKAGDDAEILDRVKIRFHLQSKVLVAIDVNEDDVQGSVAGYIDGPVRVIRGAEHDVKIGGLFDLHLEMDTTFTREMFSLPTRIHLPLTLATVAKSATLDGGLDLNSTAQGMKFYPASMQPYAIDGRMDQAERALRKAEPAWLAYSGHGATMFILGRVPRQYGLTGSLAYLDDAAADAGPDEEPGAWGQGMFRFDLMRLKKGLLELSYHLVFFRGAMNADCVRQAQQAVNKPIEITVREEAVE